MVGRPRGEIRCGETPPFRAALVGRPRCGGEPAVGDPAVVGRPVVGVEDPAVVCGGETSLWWGDLVRTLRQMGQKRQVSFEKWFFLGLQ